MRGQFLATMIALAGAAFGVIAALAWNAFITELLKSILPAGSDLLGLLVYAVIVTVIAVLVMMWLGRLAEKSGGKSAI